MSDDLRFNSDKMTFLSDKKMLWIPVLYFLYPLFVFLIKGKFDLITGLIPFFSIFIWYRYRKIDVYPEKIILSTVILNYQIKEIKISNTTHVVALKKKLLTNEGLFIQDNDNEIVLNRMDWPDYEDLLFSISKYQNITYVNSAKEIISQTITHQDIGQKPLYLILLSVFILLFSLYLTSHLEALHLFTEPSELLLFLTFPVGLFISYLTLKNTKNNQIFITSLICGLLLGFCLNFMVLQVNRLLNEREPNIQYYEFEMIGFTNDGFQKWKPINSEDIQFHSEWFGVNAIWKGYVPATIGDVRSFPIIHGFMNDLAVSPTQSKPVKIHNGN